MKYLKLQSSHLPDWPVLFLPREVSEKTFASARESLDKPLHQSVAQRRRSGGTTRGAKGGRPAAGRARRPPGHGQTRGGPSRGTTPPPGGRPPGRPAKRGGAPASSGEKGRGKTPERPAPDAKTIKTAGPRPRAPPKHVD